MRYRSERNDRYTGYALATVNSVLMFNQKLIHLLFLDCSAIRIVELH